MSGAVGIICDAMVSSQVAINFGWHIVLWKTIPKLCMEFITDNYLKGRNTLTWVCYIINP